MREVQYNSVGMLRLLLTLLACCGLYQAPALASDEAEGVTGSRPNIIVILADDMGWGDVGLNGADLLQTPNIDRIGREGVQLNHFYAAANVCSPSRASLLTGRYAIRSGMQFVIRPHSAGGMPADEITLADMLKNAGYATGMVGKWHLGHRDDFWPTNQGFDEFFGVPYSNDMQPFDLYEQKTIIESPVDQAALTDRYTEATTSFIRRHAGSPFFLYFAQTFPHVPLHVPTGKQGQSQAGMYGDVIQHLDSGIGAILRTLEEEGIADNTLIIFTSDNGPWFEGDAGAFRGRKGGTHEGSYLVPFLARWPEKIPAGTSSSAMSMNIDLLPTLARVAGASLPEDRTIDGRDITPLLMGEQVSPHDVLFFFNGNDVVGARDARFRLVLHDYYRNYYVPFEHFGAKILFDLQQDPQERFNYSHSKPDEVKRLMQAVQAMRAGVADLIRKPESLQAAKGDTRVGPDLDTDTP
jgi:uncharacterized sulfatase